MILYVLICTILCSRWEDKGSEWNCKMNFFLSPFNFSLNITSIHNSHFQVFLTLPQSPSIYFMNVNETYFRSCTTVLTQETLLRK